MEQWKDIKGFEDFYLVSSLGRIMSIAPGRAKTKGRMLAPRKDGYKDGYLSVRLYKGGTSVYKRIHRLVAEAFIPNPEMKTQVNHKDGNKRNNAVENLEWATASENVVHAHLAGLNKHSGGGSAKPVVCVETGKVYASAVEAARVLSLGNGSVETAASGIRVAVTGRTASRRAYGFHWENA